MRHYFLGLAANYSRKERLAHTFAIGLEKDRRELKRYLQERYGGETILAKNGRSALAMALMAYFEPGDAVMVNGFTCYAVFEAIKYAKLKPVFVDIDTKDLNAKFTEYDIKQNDNIKGIIIQNTFGNPVDIESLEKFAKQHGLVIIEDLAHSAGIKYPDGREAGTVGAAAVFSFGKDKSIDTISGGAVVFRHPCYTTKGAPRFLPKKHEPSLRPKASDTLRARFYPLFGAVARGLSYVHLSSCWVNLLLKIHWIEKSADNKLDLERKISKFEAKVALRQFKNLTINLFSSDIF